MQSAKELKEEQERFAALRGLTETYEDVAVTRMQQIRKDVIATRLFLGGVEEIYALAKAAYLGQIVLITNKKKRERELAMLRKNRKAVIVFISGNHSLLGNIIFQSYKVFLELVRKVEADHVILGNIGRYLASAERPSLAFSYFPFDDFELVDENIKPVVDLITNYERIFVVYPRFESVLVQVPQIDDISGSAKVEQTIEGKKRYFFEPSSRDVMSYFEGQIIGVLFRQKMLEAMLARYSSRLAIMDEATQTIKKFIIKNDFERVMAARRLENKKMLTSFSGISIWEEK